MPGTFQILAEYAYLYVGRRACIPATPSPAPGKVAIAIPFVIGAVRHDPVRRMVIIEPILPMHAIVDMLLDPDVIIEVQHAA